MPQRGLGRRVTAVQRFTTNGDTKEFERELDAYARCRERRRGFESQLTVRLLDRPEVYVHLDQWSGLEHLLDVAHSEADSLRLRRLDALAEPRTALAVSVGRVAVRSSPLADAECVVLTHAAVCAEPSRFELDFGALVGQCVTVAGFGGSDLLRSAVDPRAYTGLMWWQDGESADRVLHGSGYLNRRAELAKSARVVEEGALRLRGG